MRHAEEYIKAEVEAGLTSISMAVMTYANVGETDVVATLMEMATSLSTIGLKLVLGEATDDEQEIWEHILSDIHEGL